MFISGCERRTVSAQVLDSRQTDSDDACEPGNTRIISGTTTISSSSSVTSPPRDRINT